MRTMNIGDEIMVRGNPWGLRVLGLVALLLLAPACSETSTGAGAGSTDSEDVQSDAGGETDPDVQFASDAGDVGAGSSDTTVCECQENDDCLNIELEGSACREKLCDPKSCVCVPGELLEAGSPCDDGDVCSVASACDGGNCVGTQSLSCDDGEVCTTDSCDPVDGCRFVTLEDTDCCVGGVEEPCSDANPCTADTCTVEGCLWTPVEGAPCDDGDGCTANDTCTGGVCAAGVAMKCDDGNACTLGESCEDGVCVAGDPLSCDDQDACTVDFCSPAVGCVFTFIDPAICDDGNQCTSDGCDSATGCQSFLTVLGDCEDGNPCTDASCDPVNGCIYVANAMLCEDSEPCTVHDSCTQGICAGVNKLCSDGDSCTDDFCNPTDGSCVFFPGTGAVCDDGMSCNGVDVCTGGICVGSACSCTNNAECPDDANLCNGTPVCDMASGICEAGAPVLCDTTQATNACEMIQCIPSTGQCAAVAAPDGGGCDDGANCTVGDACQSGTCQGAPVDCDDGNPCSSESCDVSSGACLIAPLEGGVCDDGDLCTGGDFCLNYACVAGDEDLCPGEEGGDPEDTDGDGQPDSIDPDDDNDGVPDDLDDFPKDSTETTDTDGDGIGDGADPDDDNDGVPDALDDFPKDPTETTDTDGDGIGDAADPDDDNDGVPDALDDFPKDPTETTDTDGDGIGDGADPDDDNDGVPDAEDPFPKDPTLPGPPVDLSCCVPSSESGCPEESCEACVCALDPYCCETQWDASCASEASIDCHESCSCTEFMDCCSGLEGTPGCGSELCEACVCPLDSDCCDQEWTALCGVKAAQFCSAECVCEPLPGGGCCESGSNQPGCGEKECEDCVCGADATCCDIAWDVECVALGAAECVGSCGCEPTGPVDCCAPFGGIGCSNPTCEECVCPGDSACCSFVWDQACADAASGAECAAACGCEIVSNCCTAKAPPGCDSQECESCVCANDSVCCDLQWDQTCVAGAVYSCEESCQCELDLPAGVGDCCAPNGTPGCENEVCQGSVCAFDPFCCSVIWDANCAEATKFELFENLCPCESSPEPEKGSCCEVNSAVGGCDEPSCEECVCGLDSLCCTSFPFWDEICVSYVEILCPESCSCTSDATEGGSDVDCCESKAGPGCGDPVCEECVCGKDTFCCQISWDPNCGSHAVGECAAECGCP